MLTYVAHMFFMGPAIEGQAGKRQESEKKKDSLFGMNLCFGLNIVFTWKKCL